MARPEVGVITNIGWAHAGCLGGRRGIAEAKAELLEGLAGRKLAILNRDSPFFGLLRRKAPGEVVSFGLHPDADVRGSVERADDEGFTFRVSGEAGVFRMGFWNPVWISSGLVALAAARVFGIPSGEVRGLLAALAPLPGRGAVLRAGGVTVVDESYNANPESMRRALQALAGKRARRRVAVLGDMAELGRASNLLHRSLGAFIRELPIERVITVGKASAAMGHALGPRVRHASDAADAVAILRGELAAGDCILVKGSRVMALEEVVAGILKRTGGPSCSTSSSTR
jgi:UDP-N-acetylmuramoyl-tripeptide--D-alanyl-D-alanine ligase